MWLWLPALDKRHHIRVDAHVARMPLTSIPQAVLMRAVVEPSPILKASLESDFKPNGAI